MLPSRSNSKGGLVSRRRKSPVDLVETKEAVPTEGVRLERTLNPTQKLDSSLSKQIIRRRSREID